MKFNKDNLRQCIAVIPNFPKKGISFKDITPVLLDPNAFEFCLNLMDRMIDKENTDKIVAIDSRGFIFGSVLSYMTGIPLAVVRKEGKLPGKTKKIKYKLEYGSATVEMQEGSIKKGDNVVIIDDLLATGGTARAAAELVGAFGGHVTQLIFVVELTELNGKKNVLKSVTNVHSKWKIRSLVKFRK